MPNYNRLRKARETVIEILNDRDFLVAKLMKNKLTSDEIQKEYKENNLNLKTGEVETIFWDDKVNLSKIGKLIKKMKKTQPKLVILVFEYELTSSQYNNIAQDFGDILFEVFLLKELQFNVTKHHMVPKHILLNKKEAEEIYSAYGINLPLISNNDIVSRYYGANVDNIFKIIRPNNIYYRKVANIV